MDGIKLRKLAATRELNHHSMQRKSFQVIRTRAFGMPVLSYPTNLTVTETVATVSKHEAYFRPEKRDIQVTISILLYIIALRNN